MFVGHMLLAYFGLLRQTAVSRPFAINYTSSMELHTHG